MGLGSASVGFFYLPVRMSPSSRELSRAVASCGDKRTRGASGHVVQNSR